MPGIERTPRTQRRRFSLEDLVFKPDIAAYEFPENKIVFHPRSPQVLLIKENLEAPEENDMGIFGMYIKGTNLSVLQVLETYFSRSFHKDIAQRNKEQNVNLTKKDVLSDRYGITLDAVEASLSYYRSYQNEFNALFEVQCALQKHTNQNGEHTLFRASPPAIE